MLLNSSVKRKMMLKVLVAIITEPDKQDHVCSILKAKREVKTVFKIVEGPYDVIAEVQVRTIERYRIFAVDEIGGIEGIVDYFSFLSVGPGEEDDY